MTDASEGWGASPLRGVLVASIGGVWGGEAGSDDLDVDILRVTELRENGLLVPSTAARRSVSAKQAISRTLKIGDIILEKSGGGPKSPVGRVGRVTESTEGFLFSNFMQLLRPNPLVTCPDYLFQFLVYFQATGQTAPMQTSTTNIRNIKLRDYFALNVPLPPLAEQERIVEILEEQFSRIDSALASVRIVRERALALRRSLLHAAFAGELTGGTEQWSEVALGDHIETIMGQAPPGVDCNKIGEGTAFVKVGEFGSIYPKVREWTMKPLKMAQVGDVLLCVVGATIGKVNLAIDCAIGRSVAALRPLDSLTTKYLYYFISKQVEMIRQGSRGSAQGVVTKKDIANFVLPLPPPYIQDNVVAILDEQFSRLDNALDVSNQLEEHIASCRRTLLHAAFSGELTSRWREIHV